MDDCLGPHEHISEGTGSRGWVIRAQLGGARSCMTCLNSKPIGIERPAGSYIFSSGCCNLESQATILTLLSVSVISSLLNVASVRMNVQTSSQNL
jgi:hypothetical protein